MFDGNHAFRYVNPFKMEAEERKKMNELLISNSKKCIYNNNGMLYIPDGNEVLGVSLRVLSYIGKDISKVLDLIRSCEKTRIVESDNRSVSVLKRDVINYGDHYMVPYILN